MANAIDTSFSREMLDVRKRELPDLKSKSKKETTMKEIKDAAKRMADFLNDKRLTQADAKRMFGDRPVFCEMLIGEMTKKETKDFEWTLV
jgi:hypothetical protein